MIDLIFVACVYGTKSVMTFFTFMHYFPFSFQGFQTKRETNRTGKKVHITENLEVYPEFGVWWGCCSCSYNDEARRWRVEDDNIFPNKNRLTSAQSRFSSIHATKLQRSADWRKKPLMAKSSNLPGRKHNRYWRIWACTM